MLKKTIIFFILLSFLLAPFSFSLKNINFINATTVISYTSISEDTIWTLAGSPYVINENIIIQEGATLVIEPGVIVKFKQNSLITRGELNAIGEEGDPVIFTSINDDARGGKSASWSSGNPAPGDWGAIKTEQNGKVNLNYAAINYGGQEVTYLVDSRSIITVNAAYAQIFLPLGAISLFGGNAEIRNSEITRNKIGVMAGFESLVLIADSKIHDNVEGGIYNHNDITPVNAVNNWWGHDSGPYHPTLNPSGQGDRVSDNVLFDPWIGKEEPEPEEPDPVIIVPGIMGSWYDDENGWELDPILGTYDNLYKALFENGGYIPEQTLFTFPYEWRQDNVISAAQLKEKIDDIKEICDCDKVDIIAHSMGGLVSRYYIESDDYENDIDQLVFLGTPHGGSPEAYLIWEGALEVVDGLKDFIIKKYFNYEAHARGYEILFDYIQDYVKSIEQLLPDYAYLRDMGEVSLREHDKINYPNNYPYNIFLENLNGEENIGKFIDSGVNIFNVVGDTGDNTVGVIELSSGEDYWPMWMHGYAEELIKLAGDGTVPDMSSSFSFSTKIDGASHLALPTKAQKQVIEYLTGAMPIYEITETPEPEEVLVIGVYSPVDFAVIAPDGNRLGKDFLSGSNVDEMENGFYSGFENETEFAVIVNPEEGDYKIELEGTGEGEYKLELNYINDEAESVKSFTGNIRAGELHNFDFNYTKGAEEPISDLEPSDNTPPVITINSPLPDGQYLHNEILAIDYSITDDLSGVSSTTVMLNNRILATITTVDLFDYSLGTGTLKIIASDNFGNQSESSVDFEIIASIGSAIADIETIYKSGWITKKIDKKLLIRQLKHLERKLEHFDRKTERIEKLIQKIEDNQKINPKKKEKILKRLNHRLEKISERRQRIIKRKLDLLERTLNRMKRKNRINEQGYDIIINNINYLRENL